MKKLKYFTFIVGIILAISACEKTPLRTTENIFPSEKSLIKFVFLSPNTPSLMIKANDVKLNSLSFGSGSIFPGIINNSADYIAVTANANISLAIPFAGTGNDSIVVFAGKIATDVNVNYSATLADTGIDRTLFVIPDNTGIAPKDSTYNIRIINAMAKSPNITLLRVDSTNATQVIVDTLARNIAFKNASEYINVPLTAKTNQASTTNPKSLHSFLRYRLIFTNTGLPINGFIAPIQTNSAPGVNRRYVSIYAGGFATGTGSLQASLFSTIIYNK